MKLRSLGLMFALVLLAFGTVCRADDGGLDEAGPLSGFGGAVRLTKGHPSISMDKMQVDIYVNLDQARVECRFTFHNAGPATTVSMGFPEKRRGEYGALPQGNSFTTFQTWVDGQVTPTTTRNGSRSDAPWLTWRVKTVDFAANQTRQVRSNTPCPWRVAIPTGKRI